MVDSVVVADLLVVRVDSVVVEMVVVEIVGNSPKISSKTAPSGAVFLCTLRRKCIDYRLEKIPPDLQ